MPYTLIESPDKAGFFVQNTDTGENKSKEPMPKKRAEAYMRALYAVEGGKTNKEHNGIMVALMLPEAIAGQVALPEGSAGEAGAVLPPEELHVTLCYPGDTISTDLTPEKLLPLLTLWAFHTPKITGKLNGIGRFLETHLEGLQALYLNFDAPGLPKAHHELMETLEGLIPAPTHGFTPHLTLAYLPADDPLPEGLPEQSIDVTFDRACLCWGEERYWFYFTGEAYPPEIEDVPMLEVTEKHMKGQHDQSEHFKKTSNFKKTGPDQKDGKSGPQNSFSENGPSNALQSNQGTPNTTNVNTPVTPTGGSSSQVTTDTTGKKKRDREEKRPEKTPPTSSQITTSTDAKRKKRGLNKNKGSVGAGSTEKESRFEQIWNAITGLFRYKPEINGAEGFTTIKQKDGSYRWVAYSSNPYLDRDRQYVSLKALQNDVARADSDGQYGPLLWWHTGAKLGDADFNLMAGKILVESGTFLTPEIGAAISQKAHELQLSLGMLHPLNQPDSNGVFHVIRRYERSLLPLGRASNPLTAFLVQEKPAMKTLNTEKEAQLINLLGPDVASLVLKQAASIEKSADELGISFKEADMEDEEDMEDEDEVEVEVKKDFFSSLTPEAFAALIAGAVTKGLEPVTQTVKEMQTAQAIALKQAPAPNALDAQAQTLKEQAEKLQKLQDDLRAAQKEYADKLKEFNGDLPPAIADLFGKRPSQSQDNIIQKEVAGPAPDPLGDFMKFATPHVQQ